jgi:hypothetical protein
MCLLLWHHGKTISASTAGRILSVLFEKGLITKSLPAPRPRKKRNFNKSHAKSWTYKDYKSMQLGHTVKLMPPVYVKPYVKRGKTDAADAEAICEAVTAAYDAVCRDQVTEQQSVLFLHRTRDLMIRQRTQVVNMIRAQLAEFGITLAKGIQHVLKIVPQLIDGKVPDVPELAIKVLSTLATQVEDLQVLICGLDKELKVWFQA